MVLQSAMHALNPVMPVGAQLTDVLQAHRHDLDRAARRARAGDLLEQVGIPAGRLGSYPHELSGGMRQRVMIAMAIALDPQILIMDEPTTALDVVTQREILEELMALRDRLGFSVLFITHDLSLLIEIADTIAVMYAGRIVETAAANELYLAPRHPYTLGLLRSFPSLHGPRKAMTGIAGSPPDLRQLPSGCVFHPRCDYVFDRCRTEPPPFAAIPHGVGHAGRMLAAGSGCATTARTRRRAGGGAREPVVTGPSPTLAGPELGGVPLLEAHGLTKHFPVGATRFASRARGARGRRRIAERARRRHHRDRGRERLGQVDARQASRQTHQAHQRIAGAGRTSGPG